MQKINEILFNYWGHKSFRPLQEEIITSVINGNDTLALLPTGGGKSVCYQIPALANEGLCIVVSPIISLIKDQVENLRTRGILAVAVHSGMHRREIDIALDYCVFGKPKFLFVSPERLETDLFKARVQKMKVNLIAVDEAHCISQWGYDFRPSYLRIAEVRKLLPGINILALTATATSQVVNDITQKLEFKNGKTYFQSFERNNLTYVCRKTSNKINEVIHICKKLEGTGIVYVRNRRRTAEIANELLKQKISAGIYHAGLTSSDREKNQLAWKNNSVRIIVATNAFGMGIDKPDVRFVIHYDLPNSPESYFQEAGRGGRDEKNAYAIILYSDYDIEELDFYLESSFPPKEQIRKIYLALGNYYKLATGSGEGESFVFDINKFCETYPFKNTEVLNTFKILELDGYISLSDSVYSPSRVKIEIDGNALYSFQVKNKSHEPITKLLLRKYPGIFEEFVKVNEGELATALSTSISKVKALLTEMTKMNIMRFIDQTDLPFLTFARARVPERDFRISGTVYDTRKKNAKKRNDAIVNYILNKENCRSTVLLNYFDEQLKHRCGKCDNCIKINKLELNNFEFDKISNQIIKSLTNGAILIQELYRLCDGIDKNKLSRVIDWLIENKKITLTGNILQLSTK